MSKEEKKTTKDKDQEKKVSTIKKLNPELRQPATPNNGSYSLNIPFGKKESFYKQFNAIPDDEKFAVQKVEHRVQKGENLISIASKYRVLVADLQTINNISNYLIFILLIGILLPLSSLFAFGASPLSWYLINLISFSFIVIMNNLMSNMHLDVPHLNNFNLLYLQSSLYL